MTHPHLLQPASITSIRTGAMKRGLLLAPLAVLASIAFALAGSLPAQATVTSPVDGSKVANGGSVKVEATAPEGATVYGIGECNIVEEPGTACNNGFGRTSYGELKQRNFSASISVDQKFDNHNFLSNKSGVGKTTCLNAAKDNSGAQCGIVVVYFSKNAKGDYVQVGAPDVVNIYVG